ncbi:DUF2147 domain-containing protein [Roseivirga echinicomitans]
MKWIAAFILLNMLGFNDPSNGDAVLGLWWTEGKKAKVRIYEKEGKYSGEIIWLKDAIDADQVIRDSKNAMDHLKPRPLIGIDLIEGFTFKESIWVGGKVYDPEKGKSYDSILKLKGDRLEVRGFIHMPVFGKSVFWQRVKE